MKTSWYEKAFSRALYPLWESGLRRRHTLAYLADYQRDQWLAPEQIAALQWQRENGRARAIRSVCGPCS